MANENIVIEENNIETVELTAESVNEAEATCDCTEEVVVNAPVKQKRRKSVKKSGIIERKWSLDRILVFILFTVYSITLLGGVLWAFINSVKGPREYFRDSLSLPAAGQWHFDNYIRIFQSFDLLDIDFGNMLLNSAWLSILPPTINLFTAAMASYVMAKYKFPGRDLIWAIMIIMMVLPLYGSSAATYRLYKGLGMIDSPLFLLNNITGLGGSMMLIAAFKGVSKTYGEAAFLEGCGHFRVFFRIILPQTTGLLTALWITSFIGHWNDYMTPIMYLPSYTPIATGMHKFQKLYAERVDPATGLPDIPLIFASALTLLIIPMILFAIFQDTFNEMNFGGGIKG